MPASQRQLNASRRTAENCRCEAGKDPHPNLRPAPDSHAEVRAMHRRNGLRWSAHFDLRRRLAPEDVQQEFARQTAESSRGRPRLDSHPLVGSSPLDLEPATVQPATKIAAAAANVSP